MLGPHHLQALALEFCVLPAHERAHEVFHQEPFDDADPRHTFLGYRLQSRDAFQRAAHALAHFLANLDHDEHDRRQHPQTDDGEWRVGAKGDREKDYRLEGFAEQLHEYRRQSASRREAVIGHARDDFAGSVLLEEPNRQANDVVEHFQPEPYRDKRRNGRA